MRTLLSAARAAPPLLLALEPNRRNFLHTEDCLAQLLELLAELLAELFEELFE